MMSEKLKFVWKLLNWSFILAGAILKSSSLDINYCLYLFWVRRESSAIEAFPMRKILPYAFLRTWSGNVRSHCNSTISQARNTGAIHVQCNWLICVTHKLNQYLNLISNTIRYQRTTTPRILYLRLRKP